MLSFKALFGLIFVLLALIGGLYASYANLRNARGPRERRFVARACVLGWLLILSMIVLIFSLPAPFRYFVALVYFIGAPILIYRWAITHQMLRLLDQRDADETG